MNTTIFKPVFKTIMLSSLLIFNSCSEAEEDEVTDSNPISSHFGEFVNLPDFNEVTDFSWEFMATDTGLYMTVLKDSETTWIYRYDLLENDILDGTWEQIEYTPSSGIDSFNDKTPLNWNTELISEHEIFVSPVPLAFETPVYSTIDMANGDIVKEENAPIHSFAYANNAGTYESFGTIVKDDLGQDWAVFSGETVSDDDLHVIKLRYGNLPFNTVCSITAEGAMLYATSVSSSNLFAIAPSEKKLYVIKTNGQVITKDLSPYYDSSLFLYDYKNKFRSSNTGLYFQFQNKVMKLVGDDNLTLFYTIDYVPGGAEAGDFCVDNNYLFATDGTRKELSGNYTEVNIIPQQPATANPEILIDYIEKTTHFKVGQIETSKDVDDEYIYVLGAQGKILVVSKHYL